MISWTDLAQIVGMLALALTFGYWGGQMHAMVKSLAKVTEDHEVRVRKLELHRTPR